MKNRYRPVLQIPRTPLDTLLEALAVLGVIAVIAITAWGWLSLPAIIPTHFGISGAPNAYGSKGSLLIVPIMSVSLYILLTFLSRFPHIYNYPWPITPENAQRQYYLARLLLRWITFEIAWMLCILQWTIIQAARNYPASIMIAVVAPAIVVVLLLTIILYMRAAARAR
jgi:uncharacterized membrane protein